MKTICLSLLLLSLVGMGCGSKSRTETASTAEVEGGDGQGAGNGTPAPNARMASTADTGPQGATITYEDHSQQNCSNRDKFFAGTLGREVEMEWDTMCSEIKVRLAKVATGNARVDQAINDAILKKVVGGSKQSTLKGYLGTVDRLAQEGFVEREQKCEVLTNTPKVISVLVSSYEFSGGAHPNGWSSHVNADLTTGKVLKVGDLLKPGGEASLNKIGQRLFEEANGGLEAWEFEGGKFKLSDNYAIQKDGLLFAWDAYEIGPYAAGAPEVLIPYKEMKDLVKADGALAGLVK